MIKGALPQTTCWASGHPNGLDVEVDVLPRKRVSQVSYCAPATESTEAVLTLCDNL